MILIAESSFPDSSCASLFHCGVNLSAAHHSPMANSLAPELLAAVFQNLAGLDGAPLYYCALACRRWREEAQRALFRTVTIRREKEAQSFLASPARLRYPTTALTIQRNLTSEAGIELLGAFNTLHAFAPWSETLNDYEWLMSGTLPGVYGSFQISQ